MLQLILYMLSVPTFFAIVLLIAIKYNKNQNTLK